MTWYSATGRWSRAFYGDIRFDEGMCVEVCTESSMGRYTLETQALHKSYAEVGKNFILAPFPVDNSVWLFAGVEVAMFSGDGTYDAVWTQIAGPNKEKRYTGSVTIHDGRINSVDGSLISSWNGIPFQSLENYFKHDCRDVVVTKRKSEPKLYVEVAAAVQQARTEEREKVLAEVTDILDRHIDFWQNTADFHGRTKLSDASPHNVDAYAAARARVISGKVIKDTINKNCVK